MTDTVVHVPCRLSPTDIDKTTRDLTHDLDAVVTYHTRSLEYEGHVLFRIAGNPRDRNAAASRAIGMDGIVD